MMSSASEIGWVKKTLGSPWLMVSRGIASRSAPPLRPSLTNWLVVKLTPPSLLAAIMIALGLKLVAPFGATVAHGFLTLSLLSVFSYEALPKIEGATMGVNYGFDRLRFVSPVRAGSRVRGRFTLTEAKMRGPNELLSRTSVSVEIDGEAKPALAADWLGLLYFA